MAENTPPFSKEIRDIAETALNNTRKSYDSMTEASSKTLEVMQKALPAEAQDFNNKVFSYAQNNINEMFDLAQKIVQAKSVEEVVKLQSKFLADQTQNFQKQASDLTTAIQKTIPKGMAV